jgi:thiol-disulfide isomerase/thioredoxin
VIGELYATQFFSSKKLKFILFLAPLSSGTAGRSDAAQRAAIERWRELSDTYRSQALFSYMVGAAVPDVLEYFAVEAVRDFPMAVAHDPARDYKYLSASRLPLAGSELQGFVTGVLTGRVSRVIKSEPVPRKTKKTATSSNVVKLVGTTVIDFVSQNDTDVLLEVLAPWCVQCRRLMPTLDILARAVAAESRIAVAKIDGTISARVYLVIADLLLSRAL